MQCTAQHSRLVHARHRQQHACSPFAASHGRRSSVCCPQPRLDSPALLPSPPACQQLDYYSYVCSVADFAAIPRHQRLGRPFREYLAALLAYLESFYERTQPLAQLAKQYAKVREQAQGGGGRVGVFERNFVWGRGIRSGDTVAQQTVAHALRSATCNRPCPA